MTFVWSPIAIPTLIAAIAEWTFAAIVLWADAGASTNRRLTALLLIEGSTAMFGGGISYLSTDHDWAFGGQATFVVGLAALPFAYLAFLGTVPSRFSRALRGRAGAIALAAAGIAGCAIVVADLPFFMPDVTPEPYAPWDAVFGTGFVIEMCVLLAAYAYGLLVAIDAFRLARGERDRARMRAYLTAFVIRDSLSIAAFALLATAPTSPLLIEIVNILIAGAICLYIPILAYGILRTQLFDIDLRIKWTIRRGTLVGAFVAAYLVAFALTEQFLQSFGWIVGGVAVGLLLFAIRPIERAIDRMADKALPGVEPTSAYLTFKKLEVYRAAVESALEGGEITPRERGTLERLRAKLGIAHADAAQVEGDLMPLKLA